MPASYLMTWEPKPRRWRKMYQGKLFTVSCRDLGVLETKEASYQAANAWWAGKRAEIEEGPRRPHDGILAELELRRDLSRNLGAEPEAEVLDQKIGLIKAMEDEPRADVAQALCDMEVFEEIWPDNSSTDARIAIARRNGIDVPDEVDPSVLDYLFGDRRLRLDRDLRNIVERIQEVGVKVPEARTMCTQVDRFLALERVRVDGGQLSISEFDTIRRCLFNFRDWVGGGTSIESIDAERWEAWWSHLVGQGISVEYKKKRLRYARSFISWLTEKGLIVVPPNLHSRRHRFGGGIKTVPTIPDSDVRKLIDAAPGQLRLHLLLMANCGMTQVDISDLKSGEVDWEKGRIERKRSKTEDHDSVPVVNYPLWPETWRLLREYGRREGERALETESGRPWVRDVIKPDGKRSKVDAIKSNYVHLQRKTGLDYPMRLLRKTSASLLETKKDYARYATLFLGHSPRSIADRHYVVPSQKNFDRAIKDRRFDNFPRS